LTSTLKVVSGFCGAAVPVDFEAGAGVAGEPDAHGGFGTWAGHNVTVAAKNNKEMRIWRLKFPFATLFAVRFVMLPSFFSCELRPGDPDGNQHKGICLWTRSENLLT
jgi:hypothetical protein